MSRFYRCDRCDHEQAEPLVYRLTQLVELDEDSDEYADDDDEYAVDTYHFCSTACLDVFVMAIPRDFEDADQSPEI